MNPLFDAHVLAHLAHATHSPSPEARYHARGRLLAAISSGKRFRSRSGLVLSSAHAMASWGAS